MRSGLGARLERRAKRAWLVTGACTAGWLVASTAVPLIAPLPDRGEGRSAAVIGLFRDVPASAFEASDGAHGGSVWLARVAVLLGVLGLVSALVAWDAGVRAYQVRHGWGGGGRHAA